MGGIFGVASKSNCVSDLFFGTDYHSHLGTRRGGMAVYSKEGGFNRAIHNIQNAPFRTKFERDVQELEGTLGIGCISDTEPQPLLVQSHLGSFAITTVGKINNMDELVKRSFANGCTHFLEMSGGDINATEMVASLINQKSSLIEGIRYAQDVIEGSMTMLVMTPEGIYAARDRLGRTPLILGKKEDAICASFENFAYFNLGYHDYKELGPSEIVFFTPDGVETVSPAKNEMKICSFLWVYYGYPTSPTKESTWNRCVTTAVICLQNVTMYLPISLQVFRIPVLHMPSVMPTVPVFRLPAHLSNIPRPGRVPLCRHIRVRESRLLT